MRYKNMTRQNNTESSVTENDGAGDYDDDYEVGDDDDDNKAGDDDDNDNNETEVAMALIYLGSAKN